MKKKILLLLPITFLLCSCDNFFTKLEIGGWKPFGFLADKTEEKDNDKSEGPGDVIPSEETQHAKSISGDPSAPFYLKVGETRKLSVTLSPAPKKDEEKIFEWSTSNNKVSYVASTTNSLSITGVEAGTCIVTAQNTYNVSLKREFTVKVIEYNESKDYLWQYQSSDKAQFGYVSKNENPNGVASGTATLNGMDWSFSRKDKNTGEDLVTKLDSRYGSLVFGVGKKPETHIHFETENSRTIKRIVIESASANSAASMTFKVGDTTYLDNVTLGRPENNVVPTITVFENSSATGKIEFDVITPDFEDGHNDDLSYAEPGAFYLKSIWIQFDDAIPDKTITLVKDSSQIEDGAKYLVVGYAEQKAEQQYACMDGTLSKSVKDNPFVLTDFVLFDEVTVPGTFDKYSFTLSIDNAGKIDFLSGAGIHIGLTSGGTLSTTSAPDLTGWDYTISSTGIVDMTMMDTEATPKLKHFGANKSTGKFAAYASAYNNIYLFKF